MEPTLYTVRANDIDLAYYEWGAPSPDAPTLLFVHATGFHGRIWDYQAEALAPRHIIALEQRGHGRSTKLPVNHWRTFGQDMKAFVEVLGLKNLVGIGHSMGAHAMVEAAALTDAFSRLILLDPTIASPQDYVDAANISADGTLHPAAKRQNIFASPADMIARIGGKSSFPLMHPRILRDYCEHGLVPVESGEFELACPPEIEAHVYMTSRSNAEIYDRVDEVDIPVTIVRAKLPDPNAVHDFSSSPTWPGLVDRFKQGREIFWPECSHFIPMQKPDEVVDIIQQEIDLWA